MADAYHHACSSARKFGGHWNDYISIHSWFDETKAFMPDFRHRALRHHAEGIALALRIFGPTITCDDGHLVPTRFVAEQHVHEDCGFVPTASQWLCHLQIQPWMLRGARRLTEELDLSTEPTTERTGHDEPVQPDARQGTLEQGEGPP